MTTGILFVVHQRASGEEAEDEAGVQTGDTTDKSSVDQVVSLNPFGYAAVDKQGYGGTLLSTWYCF